MKELNNLEKQRIGKSFKYYRKKKNIQWKEIEKICSPATYSKLEKGNITKNSTIYDDLFELLNIKYDAKPNFDSWLIAYLLKLNDILEYYKEDEFDSLFEELEKKYKFVDKCTRAGISTFGSFIFGFPGETSEQLKETAQFALSLNLDAFLVNYFVLIPKTPICDKLVEEGKIDISERLTLASSEYANFSFDKTLLHGRGV